MTTLPTEIETMILRKGLTPGARLPPERQLAVEFGVSRSRLREALQHLSSRGIVTSRQGGGTFVADASMLHLQSRLSSLSHLMQAEPAYWQDVMEIRRSLDADAAFHAAARATAEDRERISAALALVIAEHDEGAEAQARFDAAFHMTIAQASHNAVLQQIMAGLFHLMQASISQSLNQLFEFPSTAESLQEQHKAIAQAVLAGQPAEARAAATHHLDFVEQRLKPIEEAAARKRRATLASSSPLSIKDIAR